MYIVQGPKKAQEAAMNSPTALKTVGYQDCAISTVSQHCAGAAAADSDEITTEIYVCFVVNKNV